MNDTTSSNNADDKQESFITRFIAATEIDPRLLGMLGDYRKISKSSSAYW